MIAAGPLFPLRHMSEDWPSRATGTWLGDTGVDLEHESARRNPLVW